MGLWDSLWRSLFGGGGAPPSRDSLADAAAAELAINPSTEPVERRHAAASARSGKHWWTPGDDAHLDLVTPAQSELPTEVLALDRGLVERMQGADLRLPTLPKTAERVLRMLGGSRHSAGQIAGELAQDQVLSAAVLRLANSALYGASGRITDLRSAAARLGNTVLRTVAMQYSLQSAVRFNSSRDRVLSEIVWNGSLASATIMRGLAECLWADDEEAYLIGLLHDIGNVLVLCEVQDQQAALRYRMEVEPFEWLCYQHHEALGRLIGAAWDLPEKAQSLAADHHHPLAGEEPLVRERHMLALTDMIKSMLGYSTRRSYALLTSAPAKALGLAESPALAVFLDDLPAQLRGIKAVF